MEPFDEALEKSCAFRVKCGLHFVVDHFVTPVSRIMTQ